jgi:hypothetical protein
VMLQARSGDKLVVFGGNSRRRFMDDLYVLDVEFEGKPMLRWHPITQAAAANGYVASSRHKLNSCVTHSYAPQGMASSSGAPHRHAHRPNALGHRRHQPGASQVRTCLWGLRCRCRLSSITDNSASEVRWSPCGRSTYGRASGAVLNSLRPFDLLPGMVYCSLG